MSKAKEILSLCESNTTSMVFADSKTGSIWGGVWGDPKSKENQKKLALIQKETKNKNYTVMSFGDAEALNKSYKKG